MMQEYPEKFGELVKYFRALSGFTVEAVVEKVGITERYLYRIENEGKVPSFDVMCRLVSVLSIPGDCVFYRKDTIKDPEMEETVHMLYGCDKHSLKIVRAVISALLENQQTEEK